MSGPRARSTAWSRPHRPASQGAGCVTVPSNQQSTRGNPERRRSALHAGALCCWRSAPAAAAARGARYRTARAAAVVMNGDTIRGSCCMSKRAASGRRRKNAEHRGVLREAGVLRVQQQRAERAHRDAEVAIRGVLWQVRLQPGTPRRAPTANGDSLPSVPSTRPSTCISPTVFAQRTLGRSHVLRPHPPRSRNLALHALTSLTCSIRNLALRVSAAMVQATSPRPRMAVVMLARVPCLMPRVPTDMETLGFIICRIRIIRNRECSFSAAEP